MLTLIRLARALLQDVRCGGCGFWYNDRYEHRCTPC